MADRQPDQYLFILGMNDSGTTFVQNSLSECQNVVSFKNKRHPNGLEGQAAAFWQCKRRKDVHPRDIDHGCVKVWTEQPGIFTDPARYKWGEIKKAWNCLWTGNNHYKDANPRVFIQKTPSQLYIPDMLVEQYPEIRFVVLHRNPYAICEGMRRTIKKHKKKDYALDRCARHWIECSKLVRDIRQRYSDRSFFVKYEDLVTQTEAQTRKLITWFGHGLEDLDFKKKVVCHSMDKSDPRPITNYNLRHFQNLSVEDYKLINSVLETPEGSALLAYFGYVLRTCPPGK